MRRTSTVCSVLVLAAVVALVTACSKRLPPRATPLPTPSGIVDAAAPTGQEHDGALALWRDFPADRVPRPIVVPHSAATFTGGFDSGEAKQAAGSGRFELAAPLPPGPATVAVELPDGPVLLPAITAAAALDALVGDALTGGADPNAAAIPPARITDVRLGTADVYTDRGPLKLPAWLFTVAGATGPIGWPAVAPEALWRWDRDAAIALREESQVMEVLEQARVSADGTLLTVVLLRPRIPCSGMPTYRHDARVTETGSAVVVGLERVRVDVEVPAGSPCDGSLGWGGDEHVVRLAEPLGGRVVVDVSGWPLTVTG